MTMTNTLLSAALATVLAVAAPATALAQAAPAAAAQQGSASKVVLDNSTRILATLEQRRAEFKADNTALRQFIDSEMNKSFDRDYAARLVLGVHGRGASRPTSSCSPTRWPTT